MNKQGAMYFKVGVVSVFGLIIVVFLIFWINGLLGQGKHFTVLFKDAKGIKAAEVVSMSGVDVGQIGSVTLTPDHQARLEVRINKGVHVPLGSAFTISSSLIGSQNELKIIPSNSPSDIPDGAVLTGDSSDMIGDAIAKSGDMIATAKQTLLESQKLVQELTKSAALLNDPARIAKIDATLNNMQAGTAGLPRMEAQVMTELSDVSRQTQHLLGGFDETRATANRALMNAEHLTNGLDATLAENRKTLHTLLRNANEIADQTAGLVGQIRETLGDQKIHDSVVGSSQNLAIATQNLATISAKLDATATDVQRLADDPRLNADVRETVSNLRATSESVRNLAERVEGIHIPGEKKKPDPNATPAPPAPPHYFSTTSLLEPGLVFDSLYDTKVERLRFDADYTLLFGKPGAFYRAGIYDATYNNRLNLEAGQGLFGNRADYRYGLIAGKIGAGVDFRTGPLDFRFDAYDPNRGTVNARVKANLSKDAAITGGLDSLGHGNRATVGVQIRK